MRTYDLYKISYEWCWLFGKKIADSHLKSCYGKVKVKKDVPANVVARYFSSPILLIFLPITLFVAYRYGYLKNSEMRKLARNKWFIYSCGIFVVHLFYPLAPIFIASVSIASKSKSKYFHKYCFILDIAVVAVGSVLIVAGAIIYAVACHLIGIVLLIYKGYFA